MFRRTFFVRGLNASRSGFILTLLFQYCTRAGPTRCGGDDQCPCVLRNAGDERIVDCEYLNPSCTRRGMRWPGLPTPRDVATSCSFRGVARRGASESVWPPHFPAHLLRLTSAPATPGAVAARPAAGGSGAWRTRGRSGYHPRGAARSPAPGVNCERRRLPPPPQPSAIQLEPLRQPSSRSVSVALPRGPARPVR